MGAYKYLEELWKKKQSDVISFVLRVRAWEYRQLPAIHKVQRPSRLDKARRLGYKRKQGYVVYRIRIRRGGRKRNIRKGTVFGKPRNQGIKKQKKCQTHKNIAEQRVGRVCSNLRVLSSYWVGQDASFKFFEVVMVDPQHKAIRGDPRINWICSAKNARREQRGLTAAGKKSRGLLKRGAMAAAKIRPSRRGNWKRRNTQKFWRYRSH